MSILRQLKRKFGGSGYTARRLPDVVYNDGPVIERLVFICGLHRSGTTLLERMLAARFKVSYLRASVPESEGQHMQSVYRAAVHFGGPGRFAFSDEMRAEIASLQSHEDCRMRIISEWSRFVVGDSPILLEKSPPNLTKIQWLRDVFPASHFIIMGRDPRAASAATQKWSKTPLLDLMRHWHEAYSAALEDFRDTDCTIIRYEDLCEHPEEEINRIAQFVELEPRSVSDSLEERHSKLKNSNAKYLEMHAGKEYGPGVWNDFGYDV